MATIKEPHAFVHGAVTERVRRGMDDHGRPTGRHCGDCQFLDSSLDTYYAQCDLHGRQTTRRNAEACTDHIRRPQGID